MLKKVCENKSTPDAIDFYLVEMSILTFNFSVSNKSRLVGYNEPYQIMPSTINYIKDSDIDKYRNINNPDILIHLNYVTPIFSSRAIEKGSTVRFSLRQYRKLADKIGTKNILIHMPKSLQEWKNFKLGFKIIYDELLSKDYNVHFEITSWSKDLHKEFGKEPNDRVDVVKNYYKVLFDEAKSLDVLRHVYVVIDTAHAFANGCNEDDIIEIINTYESKIKYLHWNGNIRPMYSSDSHVPIFSSESLMSYEKMSKEVAKMKKICVCEITKEGEDYVEWNRYASKYGFHLVSDNDAATM